MEKNKHYNEMIPCNCDTCGESVEPYLFKHELIKKFAAKNRAVTLCGASADEVSIEGLLKGFKPPEPKKDIVKPLIAAAHHLQDIAATIKPDEDSRTGFIAKLLTINGLYVKDQTRAGHSASGKSPGRLDIKIESPERLAEAIIEAFILNSLNRAVIDGHIAKIFGYDGSGLAHNFIIVYAEVKDFIGLWQKYLRYLPEMETPYQLTGMPAEHETGFAGIKLAAAEHRRQGKETTLYHLFVDMNPPGITSRDSPQKRKS